MVGAGVGGGVDGAGAGAELGGVSVGDGDEPPPPPPFEPPDEPGVPDEPDEPEVLDEPDELEERAAAWPGRTVGCAPPAAPARARAWCRWPGGEAAGPAGEPGTVRLALGAGAACAVVWAGPVRANKVAMPTAVTALIWVARQVRRDRRRSPSARASPGNSIGVVVGRGVVGRGVVGRVVVGGAMVGGVVVGVTTAGKSRYGSPVPWV